MRSVHQSARDQSNRRSRVTLSDDLKALVASGDITLFQATKMQEEQNRLNQSMPQNLPKLRRAEMIPMAAGRRRCRSSRQDKPVAAVTVHEHKERDRRGNKSTTVHSMPQQTNEGSTRKIQQHAGRNSLKRKASQARKSMKKGLDEAHGSSDSMNPHISVEEQLQFHPLWYDKENEELVDESVTDRVGAFEIYSSKSHQLSTNPVFYFSESSESPQTVVVPKKKRARKRQIKRETLAFEPKKVLKQFRGAIKAMFSTPTPVLYKVAFDDRVLGMLLDEKPDSKGIVVSSFSMDPDFSPGPAERCGKIQVGDTIVAINGESFLGKSVQDVTRSINTVPRPFDLTFQRGTLEDVADANCLFGGILSEGAAEIERGSHRLLFSQSCTGPPHCFQVVFNSESLGMYLDDDGAGRTVLKEFKNPSGIGPGPAEMCGLIKIGDEVVKVNGESVTHMAKHDVVRSIIYAKRPVTIQFERHWTNMIAIDRANSTIIHDRELEYDLTTVHYNVRCDTCGMYPLVGKRYRTKHGNNSICGADYDKLSLLNKKDFDLTAGDESIAHLMPPPAQTSHQMYLDLQHARVMFLQYIATKVRGWRSSFVSDFDLFHESHRDSIKGLFCPKLIQTSVIQQATYVEGLASLIRSYAKPKQYIIVLRKMYLFLNNELRRNPKVVSVFEEIWDTQDSGDEDENDNALAAATVDSDEASDIVHTGVSCSKCGRNPIRGSRYRKTDSHGNPCTYNLCQLCHRSVEPRHKDMFVLVTVDTPTSREHMYVFEPYRALMSSSESKTMSAHNLCPFPDLFMPKIKFVSSWAVAHAEKYKSFIMKIAEFVHRRPVDCSGSLFHRAFVYLQCLHEENLRDFFDQHYFEGRVDHHAAYVTHLIYFVCLYVPLGAQRIYLLNLISEFVNDHLHRHRDVSRVLKDARGQMVPSMGKEDPGDCNEESRSNFNEFTSYLSVVKNKSQISLLTRFVAVYDFYGRDNLGLFIAKPFENCSTEARKTYERVLNDFQACFILHLCEILRFYSPRHQQFTVLRKMYNFLIPRVRKHPKIMELFEPIAFKIHALQKQALEDAAENTLGDKDTIKDVSLHTIDEAPSSYSICKHGGRTHLCEKFSVQVCPLSQSSSLAYASDQAITTFEQDTCSKHEELRSGPFSSKGASFNDVDVDCIRFEFMLFPQTLFTMQQTRLEFGVDEIVVERSLAGGDAAIFKIDLIESVKGISYSSRMVFGKMTRRAYRIVKIEFKSEFRFGDPSFDAPFKLPTSSFYVVISTKDWEAFEKKIENLSRETDKKVPTLAVTSSDSVLRKLLKRAEVTETEFALVEGAIEQLYGRDSDDSGVAGSMSVELTQRELDLLRGL